MAQHFSSYSIKTSPAGPNRWDVALIKVDQVVYAGSLKPAVKTVKVWRNRLWTPQPGNLYEQAVNEAHKMREELDQKLAAERIKARLLAQRLGRT